MSEGSIGLVIHFALTLVFSLLFFRRRRRVAVQSLLAAISANVVFQVVIRLNDGYFDPFAIIAMVTGTFISFILALIVQAAIKERLLKHAEGRTGR